MKPISGEPFLEQPESGFVRQGGELRLSNLGQLELLRTMSGRGIPLRTTVRGFSMYPFIRDQDVLTIAPMNGRSPALGEVVAFTHPHTGRLTIHRVVSRKGSEWMMRGDNCPEAEGPVAKKNIIGYVKRAERQGREVRLGFGLERSLIALLNRGNGLVRLKRLFHMPRRAVGFVLSYTRALPPYRAIGRLVAPRFSILEAEEKDFFIVHHKLNPFALYQRRPKNQNATN